MTDTVASQLQSVVLLSGDGDARASFLNTVILYNIPAEFALASQLSTVTVSESAPDALASQLQTVVVYGGRPANPIIKTWTFSLDDHDFYVIGLGDGDTLVYDITTGQWATWANGDSRRWSAVYGTNWTGAVVSYTTDIVAGDDVNGAIYFLDPEYPYDDNRWRGEEGRALFTCYATGQFVHRGHDTINCGIVSLIGSFGDTFEDSLATVTLEYSDDAGRTYLSAGSVDVTPGDYAARVEWRSMGSIRQPGRLFRITDAGAVTRIDELRIQNI